MSAKTMAKGMKTTKDTAQQAVAAPAKEMPLYVAEKDAVQEGRLVAEINMITEQTKHVSTTFVSVSRRTWMPRLIAVSSPESRAL